MGNALPLDLGVRLAAELDAARMQLETLAVDLCLDPVVFSRHGATLQQFDQLAQVIGEAAGLLRQRETAHDAIAAVRLETMRVRLYGASW